MITFIKGNLLVEPVLYRPQEGGLLERLASEKAGSGEVRELLDLAAAKGFSGDLWQDLIADFLLTDENPFTLSMELRAAEGPFAALAAKDLALYRTLFTQRPAVLREAIYGEFPQLRRTGWGELVCAAAKKLAAAGSDDAFAAVVLDNLRENGCGTMGMCGAFRTAPKDGKLVLEPVYDIGNASFEMLIGCENETAKLKANTEAFLAGHPCNNVLLYGDSGSGKSTSIKALVNEYRARGLRLIELSKDQFRLMPDILALLKNRVYRFILYIDDLSFEEFETEYKLMKSVIEGGMEPRPENVLIYATSNRRHLIKETWNDRNDMERVGDVHRSDSIEEKLSLAGRFGLAINYSSPDRKNYHRIVLGLAEERGLVCDEAELLKQADAWEIRHGGLSGRTAKQFVDSLPESDK